MCDKKNKLLITLFAKAGCHFRFVYKWRCTQNWKGIDCLIVAHDDEKETIPPDRTGGGRPSTFRTSMVFVSPRKNKLISLLKKLCKIFGLKIPWQYICCDVSVCHKFRYLIKKSHCLTRDYSIHPLRTMILCLPFVQSNTRSKYWTNQRAEPSPRAMPPTWPKTCL